MPVWTPQMLDNILSRGLKVEVPTTDNDKYSTLMQKMIKRMQTPDNIHNKHSICCEISIQCLKTFDKFLVLALLTLDKLSLRTL